MDFRRFITFLLMLLSLTAEKTYSQEETYPFLSTGIPPLADTIKLLDSLYSYFWRTNIGYWVNEDLDLFYYDHNTDLIKWNRKHWDESYGYYWYDDYRVLYTLDNGLPVEEMKQEYDLSGQTWNNYTLFIYTYDDHENMTEWSWQRWSEDITDWMNFRLNQYLYNDAGRQIQSVSSTWDPESSTWLLSQKIETLYNEAGNDSLVVTSYWNSSDSVWSNLILKANLYDQSGNLVNVLMQVWDDGSNAWINSSNSISQFDDDNHILETVYQHWNTDLSAWEDKTRTEYSHNEPGLISYAVSSLWNKQTSTWENTSKSIYEYDQERDQLDIVLQNWNQDQEWQNSSRKHFVYMKVLSLQESGPIDPVSCKWTIISSETRCISCKGLTDHESYVFTLHSIQGSSLFSMPFRGDQPICIRGKLTAGIYLMTIASKNYPVHSKKIFIP